MCLQKTLVANNWSRAELTEFQDLVLKYTRENILKINIYIKEPFARKYIMVEYASMYEDFLKANLSCPNYISHFSFTWISNIGGLMGLCIGGSIITLIEIIWFLSRALWNYFARKINVMNYEPTESTLSV